MNGHTLMLTLAAAVLTAVSVYAEAGEKPESKKQTVCPVMGGKINTNQYADVQGYRIYVCCQGCTKIIETDPEKFIAKMKETGVEPEKAPSQK